jgi:hypothetical protein
MVKAGDGDQRAARSALPDVALSLNGSISIARLLMTMWHSAVFLTDRVGPYLVDFSVWWFLAELSHEALCVEVFAHGVYLVLGVDVVDEADGDHVGPADKTVCMGRKRPLRGLGEGDHVGG